MLGAQSDNELLVGLLLAALVEDTHVGLAAVEGLGSLTQTTGKTVVDQGDAEDTLQSVEDGHLAGASVGGNLDLIGGGNRVLDLFSVRLYKILLACVSIRAGAMIVYMQATSEEWDEYPEALLCFPQELRLGCDGEVSWTPSSAHSESQFQILKACVPLTTDCREKGVGSELSVPF